jgi:hypothetical protein
VPLFFIGACAVLQSPASAVETFPQPAAWTLYKFNMVSQDSSGSIKIRSV